MTTTMRKLTTQAPPPPPPEEEEEEEDKIWYDVNYIIKHRGSLRDREYFVKWKNYKKATWAKHVTQAALKEYWEKKKKG